MNLNRYRGVDMDCFIRFSFLDYYSSVLLDIPYYLQE